MMIWRKVLLSFAVLAFTGGLSAGDESDARPLLTIIYTGEAHAALLPCDCPLQPIGGVARRASAISKYRQRGPVLLLDAGAWSAGGIYDEESDGDPGRDALRTELMARAMQLMRYDLTLGGEVDAHWLNNQKLWPSTMLRPHQTLSVPAGDLKRPVLVTGWTEPGATVLGQSANKLPGTWPARKDLPAGAFHIHLSRLGEGSIEALAQATGAELIINAGRKVSQRIAWKAGHSTVANFDYQAQRLGIIEVFAASPAAGPGQALEIRVRHETLGPSIPDDREVATLLKPHLETLKKRGKKRLEMEYWTMPECPHCTQTTPEVHQIAAALGARVELNVRFVLHKEDGKLGTLHGERELNEMRLQALIRKHYPEQLWPWMLWRLEHKQDSWEQGAAKFGILPARLRGGLASGEADALLELDLDLAARRRIEGTPAFVIANQLYQGPSEPAQLKLQLLRVICGLLEAPKPEGCKAVPQCFFDAQCRQRGFIGKCVDPAKPQARCDFSQQALKVPALVITDSQNIVDNHERMLELIIGDLPGLDYRIIDVSNPEARALIEQGKLTRLPAYLLDPIAKQEAGYGEGIGRALLDSPALGQLVLNPFMVGAHRLLHRPRLRARADLFVSRLSKSGQEAVECALEYLKAMGPAAPQVAIHDALYWKQSKAADGRRELAAAHGLPELEEAARAAAVRLLAPEKFNAYLLERGRRRGSSYWDQSLRTLGLDVEKIRALAEGPSEEVLLRLHAEADLLESFDAGGEITFIAENCELIPIRSAQDLRQMLERIAQRKAEGAAQPAQQP